jgi:signal transduction histidine kinase/HAMP domain-containing protein/ActR/RegA family two-component response regulator
MHQIAPPAGGAGPLPADADARYSDGDLEPLREALLALTNGDFTRKTAYAGHNSVGTLGQIWPLIDGVAVELSALMSEVTRRAEQVRDIATVTTAVAKGDLTRKVSVDAQGEMLQLKQVVNTMVDQLSAFADEVTRVAREVGTEGRLGGQAHVRGVSGVWADLTNNVNRMASNLTLQVRNVAQVTTAVAEGDLSKKITVDAQGEVLQLKVTINTMVDQLSAFADEVTRVAREVGTEGRLGGQANVRGVSGVWADLTNNVNRMASNLTAQVRNIAQVTTAVADGDLSKKIDVRAEGEILELKTTINTMVDTLSAFAVEVTRVAREVGTEGRLGGQAEVEGVSGTWFRLTESVNGLASNLTTQVRAIAAVASAVAEGDLTQSISVSARGEVAELKDNINLMVANLRETTRANQEQDWLNTNLARLSSLMQGHRDSSDVARLIMTELTPLVSAQYGALYLASGDSTYFDRIAAYGFAAGGMTRFTIGEGLAGQSALDRAPIVLFDVPASYVCVGSGLGSAAPGSLAVLPILFEGQVLGVLELASLYRFSDLHLTFFDRFVPTIGVTLNAIMANARTETLLEESQSLTVQLRERSDELQRQQGELRRSNAELEEKAALLAKQNRAIEVQNFQIEQARRTLEERAQQLALSSQYKSEFLANMSHELRTPLNSLLVLAELLATNPDRNLSAKQVEFAATIHEAGSDLLQLINDILDLSKVEAGKMDVHPTDISLDGLLEYVDATFRPTAARKALSFSVAAASDVPRSLHSDEQRLQQILRNLLSNAVKFTATGSVTLWVSRAASDVSFAGPLRGVADVVAFAVTDTGIGIAEDKLDVIFGAFQQADGTTARSYPGTGLGLSISRDIARLIGGEVHATSRLGHGSVFTFYLPAVAAVSASGEPEPTRQIDARRALASVSVPALIAGSDSQEMAPPPDDDPLDGAKILIVDDDVRNVFALTAIFERLGTLVRYAENGRTGIHLLESEPDIALVLMDVMMPELDGYATTAEIRRRGEFTDLPIIAVTAKAMKGDREKALEAGASEYVTKPVDISYLLGLIRAWLAPTRSITEGSL